MGQQVDFGVFLPVTNNGWIISKTSPQFLPSFAHNREIVQLAERIGFSYVFSMAKWRGFGGQVEFWKYSIESMILMTGLASTAPTLRLIASIAPALMHPGVFAKMAATMDDVSGGRMGFNIVSAANKGEYTQMGMWPERFEDYRYEYCEEWMTVVKRLWTEDGVTFDGKYFHLDDCQSWPHPVQNLPPIVCATTSERGWKPRNRTASCSPSSAVRRRAFGSLSPSPMTFRRNGPRSCLACASASSSSGRPFFGVNLPTNKIRSTSEFSRRRTRKG